MDHPWLNDNSVYDPYEEPDYPQPQEPAVDRPQYRSPVIDRAVRVYTVAQESRYLIIRNLPVTNIINELIQQLALYGTIEEYNILTDEPSAPFTQTVWVKYKLISAARQAKHKLNKSSFFGQDLWIQYAPEYEDVHDVELKLKGRKLAVQKRLEQLITERPDSEIHQYKRKGKVPLQLLSTSGLLGQEEAIPAYDYSEVQISQQPIDPKTVGFNTLPLKRKIKRSAIPPPPPLPPSGQQDKEIGPLREGKKDIIEETIALKVKNKLDAIERKVESVDTSKPVKKRRRI